MKYRHTIAQNKRAIIALIALVSVIGSTTVWALTNTYSSQEAEGATRSANVTVVSDTTASNSSVIKFGEAATSSCPVASRVTVTNANRAEYPAYPIGTKVYVPGGPDPWGGCFPNEVNTGYPHGLPGDTRTPVTLTDYTGPCMITVANTVIDKKRINCSLEIWAQNVTITNSHITGRVYLDDVRCDTASFTIRDSTIITEGGRGLQYCSYTAERVDVSESFSMAVCKQGCVIRDSYLHHPSEDPTGKAHNSTVRLSEYATLEHNTLWCKVKSYPANDGSGDWSGCSANQTAYSHDGAPPYNTTVRRNFYAASDTAGYCAFGGSTGGAGANQVHDIKYVENVFERGTLVSDWSPGPVYMCGFWGPMTSLDLSRPGNEFTGNTWDNGKLFWIDGDGWSQSWSNVCGSQPQCTW